MNKKELLKISKTFEQDDYDIPQSIEWYSRIDAPTIEAVKHPDNLWSILDRMATMVMESEISPKQKQFLEHFLYKWMIEIEPYCVRLECE